MLSNAGRGCIELVKLHTIEIGFSEMSKWNFPT